MKIIYQEKDNECGPCVIAMLANEINDLEIDKGDVISKSQLSSSGMSVSDLEELGLEFGIQLEAFECDYKELKDLDRKHWYVALVRRDNGLHYVVFKPKYDQLYVYDSVKGFYKTPYSQFNKEFANVLLTVRSVKFDESKLEDCNKFKLSHFVSIPFLCVCTLLQIVGIVMSLVIAQLFKTLIDGTINYGTVVNLLLIIVPFVVMKLIELLISALVSLIETKQYKVSYQKWWDLFLRRLSVHPFQFYKQTPYGTIFELDNHLSNVLNFCLTKIVQWVASSIMAIVTLVILAINEPIFIAISLGQILVSSIIILIKFYCQRNSVDQTVGYTHKHHGYLTQLATIVAHENDYGVYKNLQKAIKENINRSARHHKSVLCTSLLVEQSSQFLKFIFWVLILGLGINSVVGSNVLTLSNLMYMISIQTLFSSNVDRIIEFAFALYPFKVSVKKVYGYVKVDQNTSQNCPTKITSITFKDISLNDGPRQVLKDWNATIRNGTVLVGKNGSGKSSILKALTGRNRLTTGTIIINDLALEEIIPEWFLQNVIYIDGSNNYLLNEKNYETIWNYLKTHNDNPQIMEVFAKTNLLTTNPQNFSSGQCQIAKLINLASQKDKLILLDETVSFINPEIKQAVFETLINSLTEHNFVIFVEHDPQLIQQAKTIIEVK